MRGSGGLPPGLGFGFGKLRYRTGGPWSLPSGLGELRDPTEVPGACERG